MDDREKSRLRRIELRREFKRLYEEVSAILFEEDPLGINFESNTDEYEPEVGTILPRLRNCSTVDDVNAVVHEEFVAWFAKSAGPAQNYKMIAQRIWAAYQASTT